MVQTFYVDTADLEPSGERRQRLKDLKASLQDPAFAAEFTKNLRANAEVRNTISITVLEGSNKVNVIPPQASAQLDVRSSQAKIRSSSSMNCEKLSGTSRSTLNPYSRLPKCFSY